MASVSVNPDGSFSLNGLNSADLALISVALEEAAEFVKNKLSFSDPLMFLRAEAAARSLLLASEIDRDMEEYDRKKKAAQASAQVN